MSQKLIESPYYFVLFNDDDFKLNYPHKKVKGHLLFGP